MKALLIFSFILFISIQASSQYSSPESVAYDSIGKRYLISNTSSQKIVQRSISGAVTDFVTVGGGIHGITVYNNRAYVCNGTRIRGYDLTNATEVFNVQIAGSAFLNDLAIDNSGIMYISDFNLRRIYKLNTNTQQYWIYVLNTVNIPNGVYVDQPRNRLLFCGWGTSAPIKSVNFADSSIVTLVTTSFSNCDGISLDRNDNVYISAWSIQSVVRYDINFVNSPVTVVSGLSNPADIYVNKSTDTLVVPNAGNSTVTFHYLNSPTSINRNELLIGNFKLHQNYPNPFNPETIINYEVSMNNEVLVQLKIFDVTGNEVITLVNEQQNAGIYSVPFNVYLPLDMNFKGGSINLPSGIYFYSLLINYIVLDTKKMILVK